MKKPAPWSLARTAPTLLLALACAGFAAPAVAQETKPADAKPPESAEKKEEAAKPAGPSQEEMMKAWEAFKTPGDAHKKLEPLVGSWTTKVKSWMDPAAPPQESEGASESKWIFDGRYVETTYTGTMMGGPFNGRGFDGYDNYRKKYFGVWIDDMGTGVLKMEGIFDKAGKVLTMRGSMDDFVMKKPVTVKSVTTIVDADNHKFEMWMPGPDGKMFKNLEIVYTRKK